METWLDIYEENGTTMVRFNKVKTKLSKTTVAVGTKEQATKGKKLLPCADGSIYKVPMYDVRLIKESPVGKYFPERDEYKRGIYTLPWEENEETDLHWEFRGASLGSVTYRDGRYFETIVVQTKYGIYFGRKFEKNVPQFVEENLHWVTKHTYYDFFSRKAAFTFKEGMKLSEEQFRDIIKEMFNGDCK